MKRRIILSIALALSVVLVSLMSSDSRVEAQQQQRFRADSGIITLGPNQILRVTVMGALDLNDLYFRVNRQSYTQGTCDSGGVCKHTIASQTTSNPIMLMPGEAALFDIPASFLGGVFIGVRGVVLSNSRNVRVTGIVFDTSTQRVVSLNYELIVFD